VKQVFTETCVSSLLLLAPAASWLRQPPLAVLVGWNNNNNNNTIYAVNQSPVTFCVSMSVRSLCIE
jgi:hypothetical protein